MPAVPLNRCAFTLDRYSVWSFPSKSQSWHINKALLQLRQHLEAPKLQCLNVDAIAPRPFRKQSNGYSKSHLHCHFRAEARICHATPGLEPLTPLGLNARTGVSQSTTGNRSYLFPWKFLCNCRFQLWRKDLNVLFSVFLACLLHWVLPVFALLHLQTRCDYSA